MIGWWVNVGYFTPYSEVNSLSKINFTDFRRPLTFVEGESILNVTYNGDLEARERAIETLMNNMGKDYYYMYGTSLNNYTLNRNFPGYNFVVPSWLVSFPNLAKFLETLGSNVETGIAYHFINLNVVVCSYNSSGLLLKVNEDGSLTTLIAGSIGLSCWRLLGNMSTIPIKIKNREDILYRTIAVDSATSDKDVIIRDIAIRIKNEQNIINYIYTNGTPDFSEIIPPDNPYEPGGSSGEGGGGGSFDNESDLIEDSSLPTLSSANTGFTRIYNPSLSQVQDLARYLWTDDSVIETIWNHIKQFFENPMEAIIGFNLVPVVVPNGGTKNFALMYIDTGVQMTVAASQFVDVDCGTLEVKEYYGSALDYSPNTKVSCFLPFIGNVSLNTDEVMGRTLQVKYRVDICSGSCVAKIAVDGNFIYQYSGHCAINIPLSAADFSSYVNAAISVGKLVGTALAAGAGVGLAATAQDATQQTNQVITTTQITNTVRNPATGRQITAGTQTRVETRESPMDQSSTQASFSGITPQNVSNTVGQIMTSKPHIEHSGGFSGNSGYLGVRRPYLIIERPNMCMPESFQTMNGFPSMITVTLGDCTGFTRVQQVQLTGLSATNPEQAEILQLLKSGVIL